MGSRSTYRSSVPLSAAHGVTRPVVGQMFHVKHWLLCRWCSGRCRALLWGRSAVCAGGQRPAREPSAPRAVRAASCCLLRAGVMGAGGPGRPRDRHTRACGSEWSISKPARALRSLRRPPHLWRLGVDVRLGASTRWPAVPRHRPRAPRPCSAWWACPFPPRAQAPSTVVGR